MALKKQSLAEEEIETVNDKSLIQFIDAFLPDRSSWEAWTNDKTSKKYSVTLHASAHMSAPDFDACFNLIKATSGAHYKSSSVGWKPKAKKKEMMSDDLKYLVVKADAASDVIAFISFMPTMEDGVPVVYCYEIHAVPELQGSGIGSHLMALLEDIAEKISMVEKIVLSCFVKNRRAVEFYQKRGYDVDEFSPPPRKMRNGAVILPDYITMSKRIRA